MRHNFGPVESGRIEGKVDPPKSISANYIGRMRGIQGNRNSCYLDATLYAMFAFDSTMDYMLSSPLDSDLRKDIQVIIPVYSFVHPKETSKYEVNNYPITQLSRCG